MSATLEIHHCAVCGETPKLMSDIGPLCPTCFAWARQIERILIVRHAMRPMTALEFAAYCEKRRQA